MKFEPLEPRTLMSFTFVLSNGTLTITGSDSTAAADADQIQITQSGSAVTATDIRTGAAQTANSGVSKIVVDLRSGDDYVRLRNNDGTKPVVLNSTIFGGLGNDTIYGGDVNDNLSGGDGDDKLQGRGGSDVYDGGAGFDTADYSYETRAISVSLDGLTNDGVINIGNGSSELDTVQNTIEAVVGGSGNDTLIGNGSANLLDGGAGNDGIAGLLGNDTLTGGLGTDTVLGNEGNDFLFAKDGISDAINAGTGTDSAQVDTSPKDVATAATTVSTAVSAVAMLRAMGAPATYVSPLYTPPTANNPADLDTSFGNFDIGTTIDDFGLSQLHIKKVLRQTVDLGDNVFEDRLLLIGYAQNESGDFDFFVGRLTVDGQVDTSFGESGGYTLTNIGLFGAGTNDYANDGILDNSGNIVLAGTSETLSAQDFALARYNSDGQLDLSFGGINSPASDDDGTVLKDFGSTDSFNAIVEHFDGEVETYYAIGSSDGIAVVYGFTSSGGDASGFTPVQLYGDGPVYSGVDLTVDSSGNLWTLSSLTDGSGIDKAYVAGFDTAGNLLGGSSTMELNYDADGYDNFTPSAIGINSFFGTDLLYVVGTGHNPYGAGTLAEAELTPSFNGVGFDYNLSLQHSRVIPAPGVETNVTFDDVAFDSKQRVIVTGTYQGSGPSAFYTARFGNALQDDSTFNGGYQNYVITQVGDGSSAAAVIAPDGIYVAGTVYNSNETTSAGVVKYNGGELIVPAAAVDVPPELDPTFGPDGNPPGTIKQLFGQDVTINDVTTQIVGGEEKILLAGSIGKPLQQNDGGRIDDFIMRLNADGTLDTTFGYTSEDGGTGYYSVDFGDGNGQRADYVQKVVVNPDNTITLLGTSYSTDFNNIQSDGEVTVARLTQDGLLDLTFGASDGQGGQTGKNKIDLQSNSSETLVDVVVQPVTVGPDTVYQYVVLAKGQFGGRSAAFLTRWSSDGLTTAFNLSSFFDPSAEIIPVAAGADSGGNLWFLSQSYDVNGTHFTLERTDSTGTVAGGAYFSDPFGASIGSNYTLTDMVIGPDDKVYFIANVQDSGATKGGIISAQINGTGMAQTGSNIVTSPVPTEGTDSVSFDEVTLDDQGRLLVAGSNSFGNDVMLFRANTDLSADVTYGDQGFSYYDNFGSFNSNPHIGGIAVQADGNIVIGGDAVYRLDSGLSSLEAAFAARFNPASLAITDEVENFLPDDFDPTNLTIDDPTNTSNGQTLPSYLIQDLVPPVQAVPLQITGTVNDDAITITQIVGENGEPLVQVQVNTDVTTYDPASISNYVIDGFGGTDFIDFSPATHLPLSITGEDSFTLRIGSSPDEFGQVEPITSVTSSNGAAQLFDNGTPDMSDDFILYTPTDGSFGPDSFSYTVGAPQGFAPLTAVGPPDEINVDLNILSINDEPVAGEDTLTNSAEDATRTILASTLLGNDAAGPSNESGQTITITSVGNSVGGTAVLLASGNVQFTQTPDYNGPASFEYTITDNGKTNGVADPKSATTTASFTITEVNDAPVATNDTLTNIAEDSGDYTIAFSTLLGNDSKGPANESGQTLTITAVSNAVGGTVKIVGTTVVFTPTANFNGPASFKYTVSDNGTTNSAPDFKTALGTASFSVTPVNDPPTAVPGGPYSATSGQTITLTGSATDVDLPNDVITYKWDLDGDGIFGETGAAAVNGNETGAIVSFIAPTVGSQTNFSVSLKVTDSGNASDTKSVNVAITPAIVGTKILGRSIGTSGSYHNEGMTKEKAMDGDVRTFFDAPGIVGYTGIDAGRNVTVTQIRFLPRAGFGFRMLGGFFQASSSENFDRNLTTLYSIPLFGPIPSESQYTTIQVTVPNNARYLRYVGAFGNIAEMEFYGSPGGGTDLYPPTAPGLPVATNRTNTSISISWAQSFDYVAVKRYDIYRNNVKVGESLTTSFTDPTVLQPNTAYSYTVKAVDTSNNVSAASPAASIKTTADVTKPSTPTGLTRGTVTKTSITISWQPATDNIAVTGYNVYRNGKLVGTTTSLSFTNNSGLSSKTTYSYQVQAFDKAGNLSLLSTALLVTTL